MGKCRSCESEMVEGAKFCIICGTTAQRESESPAAEKELKKGSAETAEAEVCSSCELPLRKGAKFCVSCGTPVKDSPEKQVAGEDKSAKEKPAKKAITEKEAPKKTEPAKKEEAPKKDQAPKKETEETAAPVSEKVKADKVENWGVETGEAAAREIADLDILAYGQGAVSKISFKKSPESNHLVVHGKVKCQGCNKLSLFSLACDKGWGGSNDPSTCPCGRKVEVGEYWSDLDDALYVWASTDTDEIDIRDYPLSVSISRVTEK